MKKFFSLVLLLVVVGMSFVGCSKESSETYYNDVYDCWRENVTAKSDSEFFDAEKKITYDITNIEAFKADKFTKLDKYQSILSDVCSNINYLSHLFVHDPNLEGKELDNAKKSVTAFKEEMSSYKTQIETFKNRKSEFENACKGAISVGIVENGAYETYLKDYELLLNKVVGVYAKMNDCAQIMFYSSKNSDFSDNQERINAVRSLYFKAKLFTIQDYMYFTFNKLDSEVFVQKYNAMQAVQTNMQELKLTSEDFAKAQTPESLADIDKKILSLGTWLDYYKNESAVVKDAMANGLIKFEGDKTSQNIQYASMFETFVDTTLDNVLKTCQSLVAFYK